MRGTRSGATPQHTPDDVRSDSRLVLTFKLNPADGERLPVTNMRVCFCASLYDLNGHTRKDGGVDRPAAFSGKVAKGVNDGVNIYWKETAETSVMYRSDDSNTPEIG